MDGYDVLIVGAGPSGVASALALKDAGVGSLVLDRSDEVAAAWRGRYDALRLNSCRANSHLPGRRFARGTSLFPSRDEFVEHVQSHAAEDGLRFRFGTTVSGIARDGAAWALATSTGSLTAPQVVVATGYENEPALPDWVGADAPGRRVLHSASYRNAEPFSNQRVLVVGAGTSAMEIANDLARGGAAKVWLSVRTPPNILLREGPGGIPGDMIGIAMMHLPVRIADRLARAGRRKSIGDLTEYGLPIPSEGPLTRLHRLGVAPAIVDPPMIEAVRDGHIEVVAAVESLEEDSVLLADGSRLHADAVICATGYRRGLERLVGGLGVLDERGRPNAVGAAPAAPGLRFIGYVPRPGGLGYMAKQARQAARAIASELRSVAQRRERS